jgi:hypothetical protein
VVSQKAEREMKEMKETDEQRSEPMKCEDCGKVCNGIQGIRGHRRGCPGKKGNTMSEPGSEGRELVKPDKQSGDEEVVRAAERVILGSRLDQRAVEMLLRLIEEVAEQETISIEHAFVGKLRDPIARERKWPTFDDWYGLVTDVQRLRSSLEHIVRQAHVSRDQAWELYQLALTIKERWVSWRRAEAQRFWQKQPEDSQQDFKEVLDDFGVPELEASWSRIIEGLRWLTSHTKATLQ